MLVPSSTAPPAAPDPFQRYRAEVERYLRQQSWEDVPVMAGRNFEVLPLARGEYNLNFLLKSTDLQLIFRVNIGTQIDREDQILYEFQALRLLEGSGVTPRPWFVDDSRRLIDRGILVMEFLPGRTLDYRTDLEAAARIFSRIHQIGVREEDNHLIVEDHPLSLIFNECRRLLAVYFSSPLADPEIGQLLREVQAWAEEARLQETFFQADPWHCIVNTEVNSGNFIVNSDREAAWLIDWEMPRWGDPSTDLCHFCSPLTTLWRTSYRMVPEDSRTFLNTYARGLRSPHLRDTLGERMRLKMPFILLRGISWSAMAWAAYQEEYGGIRNERTWATLNTYLTPDFIRSLFSPYLPSLG